MNYIYILLIGASLSVDAFSFALAYGLLNIRNKKILLISSVVGLFHFIMPLLGMISSDFIMSCININPKILLILILVILAYEIYKSDYKNQDLIELKIRNVIFFSLAVSLDGFTIGLGIKYLVDNVFLACLLIAIEVSLITFFGFKLGKHINEKIGNKSKTIGVSILIGLIIYLIL